jgi:LPXTG-motif cell wall-anchored protein
MTATTRLRRTVLLAAAVSAAVGSIAPAGGVGATALRSSLPSSPSEDVSGEFTIASPLVVTGARVVPAAVKRGDLATVVVDLRNDLATDIAGVVVATGAPLAATSRPARIATGSTRSVVVPVRACQAGTFTVPVTASGVADGVTVTATPASVTLSVATGRACPPRRPGDAPNSIRIGTPRGALRFTPSVGTFTSFRQIDRADLVPAPPRRIRTPYGAFDFVLSDVPVGSTVTIQVLLPERRGRQWVKLVGGRWVTVPSVRTGNTLVVELTDGGPGDLDGAANGEIVDPAAPVDIDAGPPVSPVGQPAPGGSLPATGGDAWAPARAGFGLAALGLALIALVRRRRPAAPH